VVILELATERQRIVALELTTEKRICGFRACNSEEKRREHKSLVVNRTIFIIMQSQGSGS
jgi:hypothetical protein